MYFFECDQDLTLLFESRVFVLSLLVLVGILQVSCVTLGKSPSLFSSNMMSVFGEITTQLEGARRVDITALVEGDAPPIGSFTLYFRGSTSNPINVSQSQSALKQNVEDKRLAIDTIGSSIVVVNYVSLPNGGPEMIFAVEFTGVRVWIIANHQHLYGTRVDGDVPSMEIIANHQHLYGTSAGVFVISDGQEFVARNGIDSVTGQVGNAITGSFHLRLRVHMSDPIPFDASSDRIKVMLESMPNVGTVYISRSPPTKERGYSWNVDSLEPIIGSGRPDHVGEGGDTVTSYLVATPNGKTSSQRILLPFVR